MIENEDFAPEKWWFCGDQVESGKPTAKLPVAGDHVFLVTAEWAFYRNEDSDDRKWRFFRWKIDDFGASRSASHKNISMYSVAVKVAICIHIDGICI